MGMLALAVTAAVVVVSVWLIVRARDDGAEYQHLSADEILSLYKMMLVDAQTYFQRITCDSFTRVPGGGADVLAPFVLADISRVNRDSGIRVDDYPSPPVILVQTARLGHVVLEFDPDSYLPVRLRKARDAASASESEWQFSDWGEPVSVDPPSGDLADNGPGGNPC